MTILRNILCVLFNTLATDARMTSSLKTISLCFSKMAESLESLENILPNWANGDVEKSLVETVGKFQKQGKEKKKFLYRKLMT